ncbi:MAG: beta-glucosidase, partial [Chitinivibrionales bacterium]|nr:beta-glucosidase [Chitinivibrionales bacterium]
MTSNSRGECSRHAIDTRVSEIIARLSLEDKIGQMMQLDGRRDPLANLERYHPGSFLHMLGDNAREVQQAALQTGPRIPLLFGIDAIHGHSFCPGASIFPTQLGLACSWNPELARTVGKVTAAEMRPTGVHWTFAPVLCITRDLRWGRVGETFGEDPLLIELLATAMIDGLQGDDISADSSILACAKHFAGYSETLGGRDSSEADLSWRKLRSFFLPPFQAAARAGCATFMTGYQAIDGTPCTSNRRLLTDTLRSAWGFDGIVVTDWRNVAHMVHNQHVFATMAEAAAAAVQAGNDLIMATPEFYDAALEAVRDRLLAESAVDTAVRRILALKVRMGLFDDPRLPQPDKFSVVVGCPEHRTALLRAARESIVLLENRDGILPLDPQLP